RDLEDLSQDILLSVVKHLPAFQHSGRRGAFRCWLRTIVCSRTADYWRALDAATPASGGSGAAAPPQPIEGPGSERNRAWGRGARPLRAAPPAGRGGSRSRWGACRGRHRGAADLRLARHRREGERHRVDLEGVAGSALERPPDGLGIRPAAALTPARLS